MKNIDKIIKEFKSKMKKLYGNKLTNIILYGSWARNEANENSDIDLLVVINKDISPGEEIDRMIDIITEINLKHNVLISVYPVSEKNFSTLKSPLLMNVRREGMVT